MQPCDIINTLLPYSVPVIFTGIGAGLVFLICEEFNIKK
jgi:hypothetical protein